MPSIARCEGPGFERLRSSLRKPLASWSLCCRRPLRLPPARSPLPTPRIVAMCFLLPTGYLVGGAFAVATLLGAYLVAAGGARLVFSATAPGSFFSLGDTKCADRRQRHLSASGGAGGGWLRQPRTGCPICCRWSSDLGISGDGAGAGCPWRCLVVAGTRYGPWRVVTRLLRQAMAARARVHRRSSRPGCWPAAIPFLAFAWFESSIRSDDSKYGSLRAAGLYRLVSFRHAGIRL